MESVVKLQIKPNHHLEQEFNTGETKIFDVRPYLGFEGYAPLKDVSLFQQAFVDFHTVCWPGDIEFAPETLYAKSIPLLKQDAPVIT